MQRKVKGANKVIEETKQISVEQKIGNNFQVHHHDI